MRQLMHSFVGTSAPEDLLEAISSGLVASVCLFAFNAQSPAQVRALTDRLRSAARAGGHPELLIGIDQEGGQLIAIRGGTTELPGNMALGATRSATLAEQAGRVLGRELLAMGINVNFAPALDVNINPLNPVIGSRAFGDHPDLVIELGLAMIRGLQAEGVIATAKHFPGHGDTQTDSHHATSRVDHALERLQAVELKPFIAAMQAGVKALMPSHLIFSALDPDNPATLSQRILQEFVRHEQGYQGLLITDAMDMYGVAQYGQENSLSRSLQAGADLILMGHLPHQLAMHERLSAFANPASEARIARIQAELSPDLPDLSVVGCAEHQAIAQAIAEASITLVHDHAHNLPLPLGSTQSISVITPRPQNLTPADTSSEVNISLADAIRRRHPNTHALQMDMTPTDSEVSALIEQCADSAWVIVGTISAEKHLEQAELVRALQARGKRVIAVALRTPYDLMVYPLVETYLCAYSIRDVSMEALARVLFGEITAQGSLPCVIPSSLVS